MKKSSIYGFVKYMKKLADELNIAISTPRITVRQVHANITADSSEVYYRRNLMVPFLDHITTELEGRFGPIHQTKVKFLGLIPSVAGSYPLASIAEVGEMYKADLPSPHLLSTEFRRWKSKFSSEPVDKDQMIMVPRNGNAIM